MKIMHIPVTMNDQEKKSGTLPPTMLGDDVLHQLELESMNNQELWDSWRCIVDRVTIELHVDGPRPLGNRRLADGEVVPVFSPPVKRRVSLKRGETAKLPRCHRTAVQKVVDGVAVAGFAPWQVVLVSEGEEAKPVPAHPALIAPATMPAGKAPEVGAEARLRARAKQASS
jgi:hypothetical protein